MAFLGGRMLFLLKQRWVLGTSIVATLAWAAWLVVATIQNGRGTPETLVTLLFISILCGVGTAALTVGPTFMAYRAFAAKPPALAIEEGEQVLFVCAANHVLRGEARGGRLFVTDRRLAFRPHRFNVQLSTWSAPIDAILAVHPSFPTLLAIDLPGGTEKLVVFAPRKVAEYLESLAALSHEERASASGSLCDRIGLVSLDAARELAA